MTYKTILVHCDASPKTSQRLNLAADLAERYAARLVGVHVRVPYNVPAFFDGTMPMDSLFASYERAAAADEAAASVAFAKAVKGKHLPTEWRIVDGEIDQQLAIQARYADLVVLGQSDPQSDFPAPPLGPESVVLASGRPAIVVPHIGAAASPGKTVMLCWNASRESARAATDALPFLKGAKKVIVLLVDPKSTNNGHGAEPGADVATWLTRHGVEVSVQRDVAVDSDVGAVILSRAADHDVDLIVMGLYGHSRLREMVLGGASRTLLGSMTVPVLMAH
jgi:nucleotide-binding universal stress UspA family protein